MSLDSPISIQSLSAAEAATLLSIALRCIGPFTGAARLGTSYHSYLLFTKDETFMLQHPADRPVDDGTQDTSIHGLVKTEGAKGVL
jgi:hypothetical protein